MAQLIQMRQRIKAIETIKKITHAMRIISMSLHGRLKSKEITLLRYKAGIDGLFNALAQATPSWQNPFEQKGSSQKQLVILIGSNKGLTGNFNTALFKFFQTEQLQNQSSDYIVIGKKAADYAHKHEYTIVESFNKVSFTSLFTITDAISSLIFKERYNSVIVFSNEIKNFFVQKPRKTVVVPTPIDKTASTILASTDYRWEQKREDILDTLAHMRIKADIQYLIFESLLAEQAARFVSMDSSTRNAANLLEETKLDYNKLRQAKITKELTELSGSF